MSANVEQVEHVASLLRMTDTSCPSSTGQYAGYTDLTNCCPLAESRLMRIPCSN